MHAFSFDMNWLNSTSETEKLTLCIVFFVVFGGVGGLLNIDFEKVGGGLRYKQL